MSTSRAPANIRYDTATDTDADWFGDPARPVAGDHVTLYDYEAAAPWLKLQPSTVRQWVGNGTIPARFVTRIGEQRQRSRVYMSGDQIVGLLLYWRDRTAETGVTDPLPRRRRAANGTRKPRKAAA